MKVVLFMATSLNGMIARENFEEDFLSEENWRAFTELAREFGNIIWGRKTYESVKSWGEKYLAGLDGLTRIVVSGNGASLGGGFQTVATPEEALAEVGRAGFAKALVAGGSHVNASFAKLGLLDEIILHVNPVVLGRGIPIFAPDDFQLELAPLEASTLSEGVVRLRYRVLKK